MCRFNSTAKCWCCYNGKFWEEDRAELIAAENAKMLQDALLIYATTIEDYKEREEYGKHVMKIGRQQVRKNMIYDARSKYPVKAEQFDQHKELFNCKNGTYNLETGVLQNTIPMIIFLRSAMFTMILLPRVQRSKNYEYDLTG